jgi:hypothetical protein
LYGCEAWSLDTRKDHKLQILKEFRKVFSSRGSMGCELHREWRKLCNEHHDYARFEVFMAM